MNKFSFPCPEIAFFHVDLQLFLIVFLKLFIKGDTLYVRYSYLSSLPDDNAGILLLLC